MTLGIILKAKDETIVIASDKRVTEGNIAMSSHGDVVEKIHKVTNKCGLTIAGDAGTAVAIIDPFLREVNLELKKGGNSDIPVSVAADIFHRVTVDYYTKYFKDMTMPEWVENIKANNIPSFRILLAGFDSDEQGLLSKPKIIELSSIRRFAPSAVPIDFAAIGVPNIARYLLYRFYTEDKDETVVASLAAFCIQETSSQDDSVGDQFQIASFSKDQSFRFYSDEELERIKIRCAEIKTEFQTSLFTSPKVKEEGTI